MSVPQVRYQRQLDIVSPEQLADPFLSGSGRFDGRPCRRASADPSGRLLLCPLGPMCYLFGVEAFTVGGTDLSRLAGTHLLREPCQGWDRRTESQG